jgi:hypothetical protein
VEVTDSVTSTLAYCGTGSQYMIMIIDIYFYDTFSTLTQSFKSLHSTLFDTLSDVRIKVFILIL